MNREGLAMINALWLILIIPLSMVAGAFCMALAVAAGQDRGGLEHE